MNLKFTKVLYMPKYKRHLLYPWQNPLPGIQLSMPGNTDIQESLPISSPAIFPAVLLTTI